MEPDHVLVRTVSLLLHSQLERCHTCLPPIMYSRHAFQAPSPDADRPPRCGAAD
jgi:hypothetical protein